MSSITAIFTWTPDEYRRMKATWLRCTGRIRKYWWDSIITFVIGLAFMVWGVTWMARGLHSFGAMIFVAGAVMLSVILVDRVRVTEVVRRRAEVRWVVSDEWLAVNTGGRQEQFEWGFITQMFRTLDGFLMWRRDGVTMWLPNSAFPSADAVEEFARIAQLKIPKYNHSA